MDFQETKLPAAVESDYAALKTAIETGASDNEAAQKLLSSTVDKINAFQDNAEHLALAAKSYAKTYETLALAPDYFADLVDAVTETTDKMLARQTTGQFKIDENTATTLDEDTFLSNISLMAGIQVNKAADDAAYAATGLPDNANVKLAYQVFMEDIITNQTATEQQIDMQAAMAGLDAEALKQNFYNEQHANITNTIAAAKQFIAAGNEDKGAVPFLVYSSLHGQYQNDEESFVEDFDEQTRYAVDSTIWGAYSLVDQIEMYFAKDSMFQIAQVPLNPVPEKSAEQDAAQTAAAASKDADASADAPTENEKTEDADKVKTVPLPQAVQFFEEKGNHDAARGAVRSAFVPLIHSSGKRMIFPLPAVFEKIEKEPEYRQKVVSDIQTGLPPIISLSDIITENTLNRATTAGKIFDISQNNNNLLSGMPVPDEMKQAISKIQKDVVSKHVVALQNMPGNEDTAACAEYLMVNAMVSVENATAPLSKLKASLFPDMNSASQTDYFYVKGGKDGRDLHLLPVDAVAPSIEQTVDYLLTVQKVFTVPPKKGDKELELLPQFQTTSPDMQKAFKSFLTQKNQELSSLQQVLVNTARKRQADAEAKAQAEKQAKIDAERAEKEAAAKAEAQAKADEEAKKNPPKPAKRKRKWGLF